MYHILYMQRLWYHGYQGFRYLAIIIFCLIIILSTGLEPSIRSAFEYTYTFIKSNSLTVILSITLVLVSLLQLSDSKRKRQESRFNRIEPRIQNLEFENVEILSSYVQKNLYAIDFKSDIHPIKIQKSVYNKYNNEVDSKFVTQLSSNLYTLIVGSKSSVDEQDIFSDAYDMLNQINSLEEEPNLEMVVVSAKENILCPLRRHHICSFILIFLSKVYSLTKYSENFYKPPVFKEISSLNIELINDDCMYLFYKAESLYYNSSVIECMEDIEIELNNIKYLGDSIDILKYEQIYYTVCLLFYKEKEYSLMSGVIQFLNIVYYSLSNKKSKLEINLTYPDFLNFSEFSEQNSELEFEKIESNLKIKNVNDYNAYINEENPTHIILINDQSIVIINLFDLRVYKQTEKNKKSSKIKKEYSRMSE